MSQAPAKTAKMVSRGTGVKRPVPLPDLVRPASDRYRAVGTEPFWTVMVKGSTATLERPGKPPVRYAVSRHGDKRTTRYLGDAFTMTIAEGPCSDGMSDALFSDRVAVAFGEGTLNGCGGARDDGSESGQLSDVGH